MAISLHLPTSRPDALRWEFGMALGFATSLGAAAVTTLLSGAAPWWLLAAGLTTALLVVSWRMTVGAALFTGVVGWLCVEGFILSTDGTLRWHGPVDPVLIAVMLCCVTASPAVRRLLKRR